MTTDRQIEANRLNALKSTGPKTTEGKEQSRLNAVRHGMAGENVGVEEMLSNQFKDRREKRAAAYQLEGEQAEWMLDRLVASSFRIERCEQTFDAVVVEQMTRAGLVWDQDQRVEAAMLAAKLHRRPALVAAQLRSCRHGSDLMIELWEGLAASIKANGEWNEAQTQMALDLLGVGTKFRDGRTALDGPDGTNLAAYRRELVEKEILGLQTVRDEVLAPLDALRRRQTEAGSATFESKSAQLILRYERDAWRRYHRAARDLRALAVQADSINETKPTPVVVPSLPEKPTTIAPPPPTSIPSRRFAPYGPDASGEFPGAMPRAAITEMLVRSGRLAPPEPPSTVLNFSVGDRHGLITPKS